VVAVRLETVGEPEGLMTSCPLELKVRVEKSTGGTWSSLLIVPIYLHRHASTLSEVALNVHVGRVSGTRHSG